MPGKIVDFGARREAKEEDTIALRAYADAMRECDAILARVIEQTQEFATSMEILTTVRHAINVLEGHEE